VAKRKRSLFKVVGWGFLPIPGERRRRKRAIREAREMLRIAEEIDKH
jgi:hypothetical protein